MENFKLFGMAVLLMGLTACGNSSQNPVQQAAAAVDQTRDQLAVSGNWDSSCNTASIFGNFKSDKEEYDFGDDGTFERKFFFYSDDNCQDPSFVRLENANESFQDSNAVTDGTTVNFSFNKVSVIPDNQAAVTELNTLKFCGVSNYAIGQASDVTAQSSNTLCVGMQPTPRTTYDIVKMTDSTHLVLGDDANQNNSSERPASVNTNLIFTKQ